MFQDEQQVPPGSAGVSRPSLTRRKYCGLLLTPIGMATVPRLAASAPLQEGANQAEREQKALNEFLEAYRLAPGQILKRVLPPRPEGARTWWKQKYPRFGNQPQEFGAMVLRWRDPDRVDVSGGTSGHGYSLRRLLRHLDTDIYEADVDGDRVLLDTIVTGDWIYRDGVETERKVHTLEGIIQRVLRLRISLTFREVERDVVVARGTYRHTPLEGRAANVIEIYGKEVLPNGGGAGGGSGDFAGFLKGSANGSATGRRRGRGDPERADHLAQQCAKPVHRADAPRRS